MDELKPCPFCGGEAELITEHFFSTGRYGSQVRCAKCHSWGAGPKMDRKVETQRAKAAEAWNARQPPECGASCPMSIGRPS